MTRLRAQVVSDSTLRSVALRIGLDRIVIASAPPDQAANAERMVAAGKPLASMFEAVIAACWEHFGPERTSSAVIGTLAAEIDRAEREPADQKSLLQEELARRGESVHYTEGAMTGPAHRPSFTAFAVRDGDGSVLGEGSGGSKKEAERNAAAAALESLGTGED